MSPASHVVCLLRARSFGCSPAPSRPGALQLFDANDRPFVLLSTQLTEVLRSPLGTADDPRWGAQPVMAPAGMKHPQLRLPAPRRPAATGAAAATTAPPALATRRFSRSCKRLLESIWDSSDLVYDIAAQLTARAVANGPTAG